MFAFAGERKGHVLRLGFLGADREVEVVGGRPLPGRVNYLLGGDPAGWRSGVRTYGEVVYRDLWPGIDLAFRGERGELKYEFRVAPRANPGAIRLVYRGGDALRIDRAGNLVVGTSLGPLVDSRPVSYQEIEGRRIAVESRYAIAGRAYGFALGAYDPDRPLVIDPGLRYSTYLGGGAGDEGSGIAVDAAGNAYVTGVTSSADFPTALGASDTSFNGDEDVFVTKLNAAGSAIVYSTYLGGGRLDEAFEIAVDGSGNAHVTGRTTSSNFPTTPGALDTSFNGGADAFVTKLNADGTAPAYSTYLGGAVADDGLGIAVDGAGNAYVTGATSSAGFPTTPGAFDASFNGNQDAFVTKLDPAGAAVYSTYLGGSGADRGHAIAVDAGGNAYVTGINAGAGLPTTAGAFDTSFNGIEDVFVTKLNAAGSALAYSTYAGGSGNDRGEAIAVDGAGSAYVTGSTTSTSFPTTLGALDRSFNGGGDAFVTKLSPAGSALDYSTYLGGGDAETGAGIAVDRRGHAYVTGNFLGNFPTTPGAFDTTPANGDAFLTKLSAAGSTLVYSTYLGGVLGDWGYDVAVDDSGDAYVTGTTYSGSFPTTLGAFDRTHNGSLDAFVTKLDVNTAPTASADGYAVDEDATLAVAAPGVLANDADANGDALSAVLVTGPSNGTLTLNADGSFTYTPDANFNGADSFTYRASDGALESGPATVAITVKPVDDAPVAAPDGPYLGIVGEAVTLDGSASSDVEGAPLTYRWDFGDGSTLVTTSPTPPHAYAAAGIYTITLVVDDGALDSEPATTSATIGSPIGSGRSDVDAFLSYASPAERTVYLPAGTTSFDVTIVYGSAIAEATFRAELERSPFAGFTPAPGTSQTVTIPLSPGRNVLVLSVAGTLADGRTATDRDRLTFVVG